MVTDGYEVCGYHGSTLQGGTFNWLPIPPVLHGIRPDVLAIKADVKAFAVGEAKTADDLHSLHTRSQFKVLGALEQASSWSGKIYIAAPRPAVRALDVALVKAGLAGNPSIVRLHIPDCLISEGSTAFA
jgi:hypothetical protein